jgi:ABC-type transport system involved in multi-copper enzyme maturation permease subunit
MSIIDIERPQAAPVRERISLVDVTSVELRKMFDTRAGFWLTASIGITALLATTATILFAPDDELKYSTFATAIGFPMAVILPMIAILSVTSEWSQRSGLTTFTLVPDRQRVILGKAVAAVGVGVVSVLLAFVIGALGTVVGSAITGLDTPWDVTFMDCVYIVLANVLGLLIGFMLGVVIRNSAGAIVAYFVYSALLPTIFGILAASQQWFSDVQAWIDFSYAQSALFNGEMTGERWAHLGTTALLWLFIPMAAGLWKLMRSEVK